MISGGDVYKVIEAMVPLYVALISGYGSVKWWNIFTRDQCDAINQLVYYFTLPLFTIEFTAHVDPFNMNYRFIAADVLSKIIIIAVLAFWAKYSSKGSYCWSITSFSLCTLTNSLVAVDLVVQSSVFQAIVWLTLLLFVLELRRAGFSSNNKVDDINIEGGRKETVVVREEKSFLEVMSVVWLKLATNPNCYSCILGIAWAFISNRWHFEMPGIIEGSILIMSKAGTGTAMFNMGIFMALQDKLIVCGTSLTAMGMVLKFIAGPAAMAIGSIAVGLHGDVLRVAIIQAALPQSITSFIFAKEYGLHADVLSTAVIFGMLVSLPVLVAYYAALEFI
ncbi:hypothetical protein Bca52824_004977 [Brassica carinata]|uniref:Auxin efflux carrier component n=1 Tax=Brassica carinata TaxID=52824 RepID=A0A8X7WQR1_BRACI|nr:hypothetical protein Bca52824_004977 [Brassica carinata]